MAAAGREDRLPTQRALRASGCNSLSCSIDKFGGLAAFSARMGLPMASRRPNGVWRDFGRFAAELEGVARKLQLQQQQQEGEEEEGQQQVEEGEGEGEEGEGEETEQLQQQQEGEDQQQQEQQQEGEEGEETEQQQQEEEEEGQRRSAGEAGARRLRLPTAKELLDVNRSDLAAGITMHGGARLVAERLGWDPSSGKGPDSASAKQRWLAGQLLEFVAEQQQQWRRGGLPPLDEAAAGLTQRGPRRDEGVHRQPGR